MAFLVTWSAGISVKLYSWICKRFSILLITVSCSPSYLPWIDLLMLFSGFNPTSIIGRSAPHAEISEPPTLTYGVPQGSILGPVPFLVYINDLPTAVNHCSVFLYEDNTVLYCYSSNINRYVIISHRNGNDGKINSTTCQTYSAMETAICQIYTTPYSIHDIRMTVTNKYEFYLIT